MPHTPRPEDAAALAGLGLVQLPLMQGVYLMKVFPWSLSGVQATHLALSLMTDNLLSVPAKTTMPFFCSSLSVARIDHELMGRDRDCTEVHQRGMGKAGLCRPVIGVAVRPGASRENGC